MCVVRVPLYLDVLDDDLHDKRVPVVEEEVRLTDGK